MLFLCVVVFGFLRVWFLILSLGLSGLWVLLILFVLSWLELYDEGLLLRRVTWVFDLLGRRDTGFVAFCLVYLVFGLALSFTGLGVL